MCNKILDYVLDLNGDPREREVIEDCFKNGELLMVPQNPEISYKEIVCKGNVKLIDKNYETQMKFCFQLFDHNNDGYICAADLFEI